MSQYPSHFDRPADDTINPVKTSEKPPLDNGSAESYGKQEDAVFGEIVEGGPNYRNVGFQTI